jgi:multisubunit Na+/H+ antiporter MnhG subunit
MAGAIAIVVVLLLIPVLVVMSGAVASAILGEAMYRDGRVRNEGSELLDLPD